MAKLWLGLRWNRALKKHCSSYKLKTLSFKIPIKSRLTAVKELLKQTFLMITWKRAVFCRNRLFRSKEKILFNRNFCKKKFFELDSNFFFSLNLAWIIEFGDMNRVKRTHCTIAWWSRTQKGWQNLKMIAKQNKKFVVQWFVYKQSMFRNVVSCNNEVSWWIGVFHQNEIYW